jgi:hypothetical protein
MEKKIESEIDQEMNKGEEVNLDKPEINEEIATVPEPAPELTGNIREIKPDQEEEEKENESELSEFDQEQLEDFQREVKALKDSGADPHFRDIEPSLLGPDEHKLYKFFRLYKKEGWPDLRIRMFEKKIRRYSGTVLHDLVNDQGHKSKEVKTKDAWQAYLLNKALAVGAEHQRKAA